jgi:hypothetical protein
MDVQQSWAMFFGGTSSLIGIMVGGVAIMAQFNKFILVISIMMV